MLNNERRGAIVEARVDSLELSGVYRQIKGSVNLANGTFAAVTSGGGRLNTGGLLHTPWFRSSSEYQFVFRLTEAGLEGEGSGWEMTLEGNAAGTAARLPTDEMPAGDGAYVWLGERWVELPSNDFKAKQSVLRVAGSFLGAFANASSGQPPEDAADLPIADLFFSGTAEVPAVPMNREIFLAFRGRQARPENVPVDYPEVEVGKVRLNADGTRQIPLYSVAPGLAGFGDHREVATIEDMNPDVVLVRVFLSEPGRYCIAGHEQAFEFAVSD